MSRTVTPPKSSTDINNWQEIASPQGYADTAPNFFAELVQETMALTRRLFIQLKRRPSTLLAGIVQPVMWLVLFGALFQNAPKGIFWSYDKLRSIFGSWCHCFYCFCGGT